jgi:hypothetical protein
MAWFLMKHRENFTFYLMSGNTVTFMFESAGKILSYYVKVVNIITDYCGNAV